MQSGLVLSVREGVIDCYGVPLKQFINSMSIAIRIDSNRHFDAGQLSTRVNALKYKGISCGRRDIHLVNL